MNAEWNGFPWSVCDMRWLWKVLCDEAKDSQSYGGGNTHEGRLSVALGDDGDMGWCGVPCVG